MSGRTYKTMACVFPIMLMFISLIGDCSNELPQPLLFQAG